MNTPVAAPPARTFGTLLGEVEDGRLHAELTDKLRDLVASLSEIPGGKGSGSLSVTLTLKMDQGIVEIVPEVKLKTPKAARGRSLFWATPENNLTRNNPNQPDLPFRDVSVPRVGNALA